MSRRRVTTPTIAPADGRRRRCSASPAGEPDRRQASPSPQPRSAGRGERRPRSAGLLAAGGPTSWTSPARGRRAHDRALGAVARRASTRSSSSAATAWSTSASTPVAGTDTAARHRGRRHRQRHRPGARPAACTTRPPRPPSSRRAVRGSTRRAGRRRRAGRAGRAAGSPACSAPASTPWSTSAPTAGAGRAGGCATTWPSPASCRSSSRCRTPSTSTASGWSTARHARRGRQRPVVRRRHADHARTPSWTTGCSTCWSSARSRMLEFLKVFPKVFSGHAHRPSRASRSGGPRGCGWRPPGIVAYADGERFGRAADDLRGRAGRAPRPGRGAGRSLIGRAHRLPSGTRRSPAERYAGADASDRAELGRFRAGVRLRARPVPGPAVPGAGGRPRRAGRRTHRRRQDRRRRVRRPPGAATGAARLLHDADQGAVEPEVRRPGRARTAPTRSAC